MFFEALTHDFTCKESKAIGTKFKLSAHIIDEVLKSDTCISLARIDAGYKKMI